MKSPFLVSGPAVIKSRVGQSGVLGTWVQSRRIFQNSALESKISHQTTPNPFYKGRGAKTLINGIKATADFMDEEWLGYTSEEIECVLDLGEKKEFQKIGLSFLDHPSVYIYSPARIEVYYSVNARKFKLLREINVMREDRDNKNLGRIIDKEISLAGKKLRYLKIVVRNRSTLLSLDNNSPKPWIFWDEINID